jgi:predicted Zn-ribbon and HTH transcriptional regulator
MSIERKLKTVPEAERPSLFHDRDLLLHQGRALSIRFVAEFFPDLQQKHNHQHHNHKGRNISTCNCADMAFDPTHCSHCGAALVELDVHKFVCSGCSAIYESQEYGSTYEDLKNMTPQRQFTYRRINHFREFLRQIQGKSRATIPAALYVELKGEFAKSKIPLHTLTTKAVRAKLKKMDQSKFYEHVESITATLNPNYKPINIEAGREEKLCFMFTQLEEPYEKIKKQVQKKRKNFMSYPYIFYKLCELNGWDEYLRAAYLLKSVPLLVEQDRWCQLAFQQLNWQFVDRTLDLMTKF